MRISFATSRTGRTADSDLRLLLSAAAAHGHAASIDVWDDPAVDWAAFDVVVVRSCWDYAARREEFLTWARSVPTLRNPADVLTWNTDKAYLRTLAEHGVPTIETRWNVRTGDDLGDATEWVVKPSVSAGSRDTARWSDPADVYAHSEQLQAAGRTAMVQPYVSSIDHDGETALLFIGGHFSHAIRKGPLLHPDEGVRQDRDNREDITPRAPTASQHEMAATVLDVARTELGTPLLYARVDIVAGPDGDPLLIELELTEPSLFLAHGEDAADRLIAALEEPQRWDM